MKTVESKTVLQTDGPMNFGGLGQEVGPTDLVSAALASCVLTMMSFAGDKVGVNINGAQVDVEKQMSKTTNRIGSFVVNVKLPAISDSKAKEALEVAALKCPVKNSLHPEIAVTLNFHYTLPVAELTPA